MLQLKIFDASFCCSRFQRFVFVTIFFVFFLHAFLILLLYFKKTKTKTKNVGRSFHFYYISLIVSSRWWKQDKKIYHCSICLYFSFLQLSWHVACSYHFIEINVSSFVFVSLANVWNLKRIRSQFFRLVSLLLCFVHDSWRWFLSQKSSELANCIVLLVTPCEQTMTRKSCNIFSGLSLVRKTHWKTRCTRLTLIMVIYFLEGKQIQVHQPSKSSFFKSNVISFCCKNCYEKKRIFSFTSYCHVVNEI